MLIRRYDIIDWFIGFFIFALLAVATKLGIDATLELSTYFHLPF